MKCEICGKEWYDSYIKYADLEEVEDHYYHKSCYDKSIENKFLEQHTVTTHFPEVSTQEAKPTEEKCAVTMCKTIVNKNGYYCSDKYNNPYCEEHSYMLLDKVVEHNLDKLEVTEPPAESTEVEEIEELDMDFSNGYDSLINKLEKKVNELVRVVNRLAKEIKQKAEKIN